MLVSRCSAGPAGEAAPDAACPPHPARIYNHLLGGEDAYESDRQVACLIDQAHPGFPAQLRRRRQFLTRAVRHLAGQGISQFLDVGCGLPVPAPAGENVHETAQRVNPNARVVYVDVDPLVVAHARALLTPVSVTGVVAGIVADLRDPDGLWKQAGTLLDLREPVAVVAAGVLAHLPFREGRRAVAHLMGRAAPDSHLILTHPTALLSDRAAAAARAWNRHVQRNDRKLTPREPRAIACYTDGLELLQPGLVPVNRWRPAPGTVAPDVDEWGAVARKPPRDGGAG